MYFWLNMIWFEKFWPYISQVNLKSYHMICELTWTCVEDENVYSMKSLTRDFDFYSLKRNIEILNEKVANFETKE